MTDLEVLRLTHLAAATIMVVVAGVVGSSISKSGRNYVTILAGATIALAILYVAWRVSGRIYFGSY